MVGFCSSARFVEHKTARRHPERPDRIRAIHRAVRVAGLLDSPDPFPDFQLDLQLNRQSQHVLRDLGEPEPAGVDRVLAVHSPAHVEYVRHVCELGGGVLDQGDTPVGPESYEIALLAAGAVLRCCDAVASGEVKRAFAAVRPPGHHAEPARPMGFCLFANLSIGARYLQQAHGVGRIAVVDFDVHHGNGTQAVFESDRTVLFISLHQHPATCFPRSGYEWELGTGPGEGYTLNIPFQPGAGDAEYLEAVDSRVLPALDEFRPELIMISAGFDAHHDDPLAQIDLSEEAFELMTRRLAASADRHCGGKIISVLEGGYDLRALGRSVVRHLIGLAR